MGRRLSPSCAQHNIFILFFKSSILNERLYVSIMLIILQWYSGIAREVREQPNAILPHCQKTLGLILLWPQGKKMHLLNREIAFLMVISFVKQRGNMQLSRDLMGLLQLIRDYWPCYLLQLGFGIQQLLKSPQVPEVSGQHSPSS